MDIHNHGMQNVVPVNEAEMVGVLKTLSTGVKKDDMNRAAQGAQTYQPIDMLDQRHQ